VIINYRLSIGNVEGTYGAITAGVAQILLLWVFHGSLAQVVIVQLALMAVLFVLLAAWDLWRYWSEVRSEAAALVHVQ
jgi:hypothetical protein